MVGRLTERQPSTLSKNCSWVEANTVTRGGLSFCPIDALARENTDGRVRLVDTYSRRPYHHPDVLFIQYVAEDFDSDSKDRWRGILVVMDLSTVDWSYGVAHVRSKRSPRS